MKGKFFIDTNILVYSFESSDKGKKARDLITQALLDHSGIISYQVVQEFINVATRKFKVPMKTEDLSRYLKEVLFQLLEVYSSQELFISALDVSERWKYGYYDSLIIAAALSAECKVIYSEDLQEGQKIYGTTIINPFV